MSCDIEPEFEVQKAAAGGKTPCRACPLRTLPVFENQDSEQLAFIETFKIGEMAIDAGAPIYLEGANSPYLYTVLEGWAFRFNSLADGRRQILNFALPGDFIGMQNAISDTMAHGIEALTEMRLCMFSRDKLFSLYARHPSLGFDLTWLAAREERFLDDNLLAVGRRTASEKIAYLIAQLFGRARELDLVRNGTLHLPMTQQHLADTLGLSLVHLNKTLQKLRAAGLVALDGRMMIVKNEAALKALAKIEGPARERRPLI